MQHMGMRRASNAGTGGSSKTRREATRQPSDAPGRCNNVAICHAHHLRIDILVREEHLEMVGLQGRQGTGKGK